MPVVKWSDNVAVVHLGDDPQFTDDLDALGSIAPAPAGPRVDVVLDFAAVHFLNSSNLARLLALRKRMQSANARLVLCGIPTSVWSAFLVTGLDKIFEFRDSVPSALASIQMA